MADGTSLLALNLRDMMDPGKGVFLSYASQDAEAAQRICEALRAAGIEVWFDQNELVGGDAWDGKIRKQIKECALFVPVISANTQARREGYFRLEWRVAVERMRQMDDDLPFLVPVVIDGTKDAEAFVPDRFRDVQWTRLAGGDANAGFCRRVKELLSGEVGARASPPARTDQSGGTPALPAKLRRRWLRAAVIGLAVILALVIARPWRNEPNPVSATVPHKAPLSEAHQLAARARALTLEKYDSTPADFAAAEGLLKQALALNQNDPDIWAFSSLFNTAMRTRGFDHAPARREAARRDAQRALTLAPDSIDALFALGRVQRDFEPGAAEVTFRKILELNPKHGDALNNLAYLYDSLGRPDESATLYERALAVDPANAALNRYTAFLLYFHYRRFEEADRTIRQSIAVQPSANSQSGLALLLLTWKGEAEEAARVLASGAFLGRAEPRTIWNLALVQLCRRAPDEVLKTLERLTDEYIQDNWFSGPKAYFAGRAHALAGRAEAARVAWESALAITETRLKGSPDDLSLHVVRGQLLAWLGRTDEALREARAVTESQTDDWYWFRSPALIYAALGRADEALPLLEKWVRSPANLNVGWPLTPALLRLDPMWDKIRGDSRFQQLARSDQPVAAAPRDEKSVAVLAFANLSDDKDNEYFSDGISEELLNVLAKVPGLKVSARTSAFYFKGKQVQIADIAQQLGVAYVVEGSVRKSGNRVRITAQLIKAADGFHVWSENFDRDLKDIFALQDEIAGLIATNLQLKLGMASREKTAVDPEAYQLYLQGRQAWNLRTLEAYDRAEPLLQRAIRLAPNFTAARAALADVIGMRGSFTGTLTAWRMRDSTENNELIAHGREVVQLDPTSAEAHASLAQSYWIAWRLPESVQELREAIRLNPNYASAQQWLGRRLVTDGNVDEGLAALRRATELDPLSSRILDNYGWALLLAGRPAEALDYAERALRVQPGAPQALAVKSQALADLGRMAEAAAIAAALPRTSSLTIFQGIVLARAGRVDEVERLLPEYTESHLLAKVGTLAALGRKREALEALEPGWIVSDRVDILLLNPAFDSLRGEPRFVATLAALGLTETHARAQAWRAGNRKTEVGGQTAAKSGGTK